MAILFGGSDLFTSSFGISFKVYYVVFLLKVSVGSKAYCHAERKGDRKVAFLIISSLFSWRDRCDEVVVLLNKISEIFTLNVKDQN